MPRQKRRGSGEGTVYRRADGLWVAQLRLPTGQRRTVYAAKMTDVQAKLQELRRSSDDGVVPARERRIRVDAYLHRWLEASKASVRPSTFVSHELNARRLNSLIGRAQLSDLSP